MKKLTLDLDQLAVESFDTAGARTPHGTVRGNDISDTSCYQRLCECPSAFTCLTDCNQNTCGLDTCGQNTCGDSCVNICPPTKAGEHTCNQPSCFYSCGCVSLPNWTECCLG